MTKSNLIAFLTGFVTTGVAHYAFGIPILPAMVIMLMGLVGGMLTVFASEKPEKK